MRLGRWERGQQWVRHKTGPFSFVQQLVEGRFPGFEGDLRRRLVMVRVLDECSGLNELVDRQHPLRQELPVASGRPCAAVGRQPLACYEHVNDAERLSQDPGLELCVCRPPGVGGV